MKLGSKNKEQKKLFLRIAIGIIAVLCVLLAISVYERYSIERDMAGRRAELEIEYQKLQARKEALETKVEYLDDESSVEAEIRRSFDVAREGEQVVIILDDDSDETPAETVIDAPEAAETRSWWQFWR